MDIYKLLDSNNNFIAYRIISDVGEFNIDFDCIDDTGLSIQKSKIICSDITDMYNRFDCGVVSYVKYLLNQLQGIEIHTGKRLQALISHARDYNRRYCFNSILEILEKKYTNIGIVYGVRRTGKTVLLYQTIEHLLNSGVPLQKIAYIIVKKNGVSDDDLCLLIQGLIELGVQYLFIDEMTYCRGTLDFLTYFSEAVRGVKIFVSGINSGFLSVLKDSLYDRADVLHTSYISYEEYHSLYPDRGIYEYINNGGILSNPTVHKNMHEQEYLSYLKKSYDYIETSIVDNLFNSLDKYEFFDTRYPNLSEMHLLDEKKLKVLVFKWIQRCTQPLAIRVLERTLKSSDIGNLENVARKRGYVGDVSGFSDALYQRLMTRLTQNNYTNYTQDFQEELLKYFSDIGCVVTCNSMDYSIFVPVAVRMGCIFELMNIVVDCYDDISNQYGCVVDLETVQITMLNNIYEVLIESIVLTDLVCKGVPVGREIMCDAVKEKSQ